VAVARHRGHQDRQKRFQPLATNPVGGFPEHDKGRANTIVIEPPPRPRRRTFARTISQKPHRVLPVISRRSGELVEDPAAFRS